MARTQRLRIALDAAHPKIVAETDALLRRGFPENQVGLHSVGWMRLHQSHRAV